MKKYIVIVMVILLSLYALPKLFLFNENLVSFNFRHMSWFFPDKKIEQLDGRSLERDLTRKLTNEELDLLESTDTMVMLMAKDGIIKSEYYKKQAYRNSHVTSFSVVKTFVSILVGIAIDDGLIDSEFDDISDYVLDMKGTSYDKVTIKEVLEMSSGVAFTEDYFDQSTDIYTIFNDLFLFLQPVNKKALSYPSTGDKSFHYASIETQILAMLIEAVYDKDLSKILEEKIWKPLEMSHDASWLTDLYGQEMAWWGLNARPEDFLKFGMVLSQGGFYDDQQIISSEWLDKATSKEERVKVGDTDYFKYGYQIWLPEGQDNDFAAIGIWGQIIYVNPDLNVVIVKFSQDSDFHANEPMLMEAFRSMAKSLE